MSVFLVLSFYCHIEMGFLGLLFIGGYLIYKPIVFRDKRLLIGMMTFLVLAIPQVILILTKSTVSNGGMLTDQWVKSTRLFSYHWYPITMKLFTTNAFREFFPILLLCFFFFTALRYQDIKDEKSLKVISGLIVCVTLSVLGIVFSDVYPIPFLIKISLQRSSGLITFFGVIYIIQYLIKTIDKGNFFVTFLSVYCLFIIVFAKPGIAVLPLFIILYFDMKEKHFGPVKINSDSIFNGNIFLCTGFVLLAMITLICIFKGNSKYLNIIYGYLWEPLKYFNPFTGFDFLIKGGGFKIYGILKYLVIASSLAATIIVFNERILKKYKAAGILFINLLLVSSFLAIWLIQRDDYLRWQNRYSNIASSYMNVQLWAKNNTASDALFMPEPTHYYGWRDFSARSDFGNHREWGYASIAYNPDQKRFKEGLKRMKALGLNISRISIENIMNSSSFPYSSELHNSLQNYYYNMNVNELEGIINEFGINYVIFNMNLLQTPLTRLFEKFHIAYANDDFFVFTTGKQIAEFKKQFFEWNEHNKVFMHELTEKAAPLVLQGHRGDFIFIRIPKDDGDVIRVSAIKENEKIENLALQFGYNLNEYGFNINVNPSQEVMLILFARLSGKTAKPTKLFIQDKTENWDRTSVLIDKLKWKEYVVTRRIRDGFTKLSFGISWQPQSFDQWLEIKNISVIVLNKNSIKNSIKNMRDKNPDSEDLISISRLKAGG